MTSLNRYAKFVAFATLCLIFAGGLVTSTGSGLAVPDWPLSFGKFFPKMEGGVFFEHGHRMVAGTVVILTVILVAWIFRKEERPWVRGVAVFAIGAILLQALLGGLTVLLRLPPLVSVAHAGVAQAFFCSIVALALVTSPQWLTSPTLVEDRGWPTLRSLSLITTLVIYVQILLGAVMRHIGAGLAIPDFPLAFGVLIPPASYFSFPVAVAFAHRVGAVVVSLLVIWTATRAFKTAGFQKIAITALCLLVFQIILGGLTILSGKAVIPTTLHVAVGAVLLATHVVLVLQAYRFSYPVSMLPRPKQALA